jgi:hypothetical protein
MLLAPHAPGIEASNVYGATDISYEETQALGLQPRQQGVRWNGTLLLEAAGQEESFAIGPDGCVWNFSRPLGCAQDAPGQLLPTGLKATCFAASLDAQGDLVVLAAHEQHLSAVVQEASSMRLQSDHWRTTHCSKFSAPQRLELPALPAGSSIIRVLCEGQGEQLHVGVLVHCLAQASIVLLAARWPQRGQVMRPFAPVQAGGHWQAALLELQRMAV